MCGRFTLAADPSELTQMFPEFELPEHLKPRYNIAPSQDIAVVPNTGENKVEFFRWGLIPSWAKDPQIGYRMINARAETLAQKPSFRNAYRRRRCLILADGFYEWHQEPGHRSKTPIYVKLKSGKPFAFAGLWEVWQPNDDAPPVRSCTIITTAPNALIEQIHNRMPAILAREAYGQWLDPQEQSPERLAPLLQPYPAEAMIAYPVSRLVNRPANDSPECITPDGPSPWP